MQHNSIQQFLYELHFQPQEYNGFIDIRGATRSPLEREVQSSNLELVKSQAVFVANSSPPLQHFLRKELCYKQANDTKMGPAHSLHASM